MKQLLIVVSFIIVLCAFKTIEIHKTAAPVSLKAGGGIGKTASIVALAEAFKATLTAEQVAELQIPLTKEKAIRWSNLPGGITLRNGLEFGTFTAEQLTAAKAVIAAAAGTKTNEGYDEFLQINSADAILVQNQAQRGGGAGFTYSPGKYIIAFLGTPANDGTWMLQFGGHHYAQNITYTNGVAVSATPSHQGLEPITWTTNNVTYAPLKQEADGMAALLAAMSDAELATAKTASRFGDVLLGPKKDGRFPATKIGIKVSELNKATKAKVLAAMMPWLDDMDNSLKTKTIAVYKKELDDTYVTYSGNVNAASGNPDSFFKSGGDYVRIDGPSVWIELVCQNGVIMPGIHYHTVFRDHARDYNGL